MASPGVELQLHTFYQNGGSPKMFILLIIVKKPLPNPNESFRLADVLKMSNIEHFPSCGTLHYVASENQGTHAETDIIRALYYLWCSDRESL
jgi:hypothetical protein